jgi:hypothetical protein
MTDEPEQTDDADDVLPWPGDSWIADDEPLACGLENPDYCESCQ